MPARPSAKPLLKRAAINLGLMAGSLLVAAAFAEAAIRLIAPQQLILIRPDLWQPADTVGWLHRPNISIEINTGERTVSVHTDDHGFRIGSGGAVVADREVLLLGDSFMEALQVEYEESGAGLLEARLSQAFGMPIAIRNAGVGGWDPDQYLLRASGLLAEGDFDLLIAALYLGNDVIPSDRGYLPPREPVERYRLRVPRGVSFREFTDAILRPLNDFLEVRSHLFVFSKNRLQTLRMRLGLAPLAFPPQFLKSQADAAMWEVTATVVTQIGDLAQAHGTPAMFVLIPAPFQVDSLDLNRYVVGFGIDPTTIDIDQPNRLLQSALAAKDFVVLDLVTDFRESHAAGERLFGNVDPHFSPAGNALFAELVAPTAIRLLSAQDSSAGPAAR